MTHCSDEDLILHHYDEPDCDPAVGPHLLVCAGCAQRQQELADTLHLLQVAPVPERSDDYGAEVWRHVRQRLPERQVAWRPRWSSRWNGLALAAAAAVLVVAGFLTGRLWPQPAQEAPLFQLAAVSPEQAEAGRRRVLLLSVAEHLERSDRVLTDVMNAAGGGDISTAQEWAGDLLSISRLYRQDAVDADEASIAAVLDEIERALLEIVHSPSRASSEQLDDIRGRIDSALLLFKVRVMSEELRQRQLAAPAEPLRQTPVSRTS